MFKRKSKSDKPAKAAKPAKAVKPKKEKAVVAKKPARVAGVGAAAVKKATDIYTVMLMISLFAVLTACILLLMELSTYGSYPWWKAG